ncbi:PREDICTED: A-kinase anchor protein 3-like, partial [Phaethon lepturus]|uniref:A-kinase anchor protein 3-like n=1 Tax=Phaethon lepturus TaxID=97097 RepID=UPI000530B3B0
EVSFYTDRLSNLVIAMVHKEINEKSDGPGPCFAVLGKPHHKSIELTYASLKTGSRTDAKAQNEGEKEMTCADAVGNHIIKQGFTLWHENQNQCSQFTYSNPASLLAELRSREDGTGSLGSKVMGTTDSVAGSSEGTVSGHRVVAVNQNLSENLQKLSSVAMEKGYKVGEILQAMLKYKKERQSGEAVGSSVQLPVLNWLLNNS